VGGVLSLLSAILLATSIEMLISWVPSKERKTIGYATTIAVGRHRRVGARLRDIASPHETPPLRAAEL
jgi:hypothetical protein